ncbi:transporter substrate-binding domain-containing protein [Robbsia sp. KACC 23696]|uniref:transporter substrate-binding domain-containing protein n=1 Tax=Robbsia sp. KACC 23696 TaxID=3149231 RepID=UPI00325BA4F5
MSRRSLFRFSTTLAFAAVAAALLSPLAHAADDGPTLDSIRQAGVLSVGVRDNSFPFSYVDDHGHYLGYSMDLSNAIVDAIKQKLHMPNLAVKELAITSQNRISLLQNNQIQLECSSTTHNLERENQVNFSNTFFVIGTRLLVPASSSIKDFADLQGKSIVTVAGSTSERLLRGMNESKSMHMNVVSSADAASSFIMLETGRVAAYMMDDAVLAGARATARKPDNWKIVGTPASREAYGCMLPKGDAAFKKLVDGVIAERQRSGAQTASYKTWFMTPTPPKQVNLDFPMNDDVKALNTEPNDKALQ